MAGKYLVTSVGEFEYPHILVADTKHNVQLTNIKVSAT